MKLVEVVCFACTFLGVTGTDLVRSLRCYTCMHTVTNDVMQMGSSKGCIDEFTLDRETSTMVCYGNCSTHYTRHKGGEYWQRGCSQDCKNIEETDTYTKCCDADFCNTASRYIAPMSTVLIVIAFSTAIHWWNKA